MPDTPRAWADYMTTAKPAGSDPHRIFFEWARDGNLSEMSKFVYELKDVEIRNERGHSLLMLAAYNGHYELSKFLINSGADVNSIDAGGSSVLMGVAFKGYNDLVHLLVQNGADSTHKNHSGQDAMQFAVMFGRIETAQILASYLSQSADHHSSLPRRLKSWGRFLYQLIQSLGSRYIARVRGLVTKN